MCFESEKWANEVAGGFFPRKKKCEKIDLIWQTLVEIFPYYVRMPFGSAEHWQSDCSRRPELFCAQREMDDGIVFLSLLNSADEWMNFCYSHAQWSTMTQVEISRSALVDLYFCSNNLTWMISFLRVSIYFVISHTAQSPTLLIHCLLLSVCLCMVVSPMPTPWTYSLASNSGTHTKRRKDETCLLRCWR